MKPTNPYEPPKANLVQDNSLGVKQCANGVVFVPTGADLPPRCVYCNQPAVQPMKERLFFYTPNWIPITFLAGAGLIFAFEKFLFFYVYLVICCIFATIFQKSRQVQVGLCDMHQRKKSNIFRISVLLAILSWMMIFVSSYMNFFPFASLFMLSMLVCSFIASRSRQVSIKSIKIDKEGCYLKGFDKRFLNGLSS